MVVCDYGCDNKGRFELSNHKWCCQPSYTKCPAIREKNSKGLQKAHATGKMYTFTNEARLSSYESRIDNLKSKPFKTWSKQLQKDHILSEQKNKCLSCGISSWNGQPIVMELDHIDGNTGNNERNNLRLLCPNCHSQTSTFRGRNKNSGKIKITDNQLIEAYNTSPNIRQALLKVGLAAKGANYDRIKKLINNLVLNN